MDGYFAPESMAVRVMTRRAVGLTYGQRALVIGAAHPLLYIGTALHSAHRRTPYRRLAITGRMFEAVFLGTREEADRAIAYTRRRHEPVHGRLPADAGAHPSGTAYSARDPELMFWTMAFTFDSAEAMHDLLVRRLTSGEREGLWQDFLRWAELFGMPRSAAPATYPEFRARFDSFLGSADLYLTDEARLVGRYLAGAQLAAKPPLVLAPLVRATGLVVMGSLPERVRDIFGIGWSRLDEVQFRALARSVRLANRAPAPLLRGPSSPLYAIPAGMEKQTLRHGGASMPGVSPVVSAATVGRSA